MVFTYNVLVASVNIALLLVLSRHRSERGLTFTLLTSAGVTVLLTGLGHTIFDAACLAGWGGFAHAPFMLGTAAALVRKTRPRSAACLSVVATLFALTGIYAFHIEPTRLELTRIRIESSKIAQPLRLAILADIQTDRVGAHEKRALAMAMEAEPDVILFLGDYVQEAIPERALTVTSDLNQLMKEVGLHAPLGVHAVGGNTDVGQDWTKVFDGLPVELHWQTESQRAGPLRLTALSVRDSYSPTLRVPPADGFHIVFGHHPDFALGQVQADLLLAGHTHGGQVRLPVIGALVTFSRIPRAWAAGLTQLDGDRKLVVSRGVGMERGDAPRIRFLCRPEVLVIDLVPETPDG